MKSEPEAAKAIPGGSLCSITTRTITTNSKADRYGMEEQCFPTALAVGGGGPSSTAGADCAPGGQKMMRSWGWRADAEQHF